MRRSLLVLLLFALLPSLAWAGGGPRIEVAFVLDATGSMGPWIKQARARIRGIAEDLATGEPRPDARFSLVRYRDKGDAYLTQTVPFSSDIDVMSAALDATAAQGGGDTPEAVIEALHAAIYDLKWTDEANVLKLIYLVGDAAPQHYPGAPDLEEIAERALDRGIIIHSIACGSMSGRGQRFFERVARLSEGRAFRLTGRKPRGHVSGGRVSAAGAASAGSLAAAVSGTAKAYSSAVGVDFKGALVEAEPLDVPQLSTSGLLGAHVRLVKDEATWADLWAAHGSIEGTVGAPPVVDFARQQVLVLGGSDAGLELRSLSTDGARRVIEVAPASAAPRFYLIPAADGAIALRDTQS